MKRFLFVAFLLITLSSHAQTDGAAPTKADAVSFVNKVVSNYYWLLKNNPYPVKTVVVSLQDCFLTVKESKPLPGNPNFSTVTIIDLSKCSVGRTPWAGQFDIQACDSMSVMTSLLEKGITSAENYDNKTGASTELQSFKFILFSSPIVQVNNYQARLEKALEFLVTSCGGGEIKKDTGDKF
jgi:hypothetical protein